ncbi:MAG: bifunctional phosphopantothenoylcysteine decarboxylase/phosphopantothenate--cysteine ligase CoaBC [Succinivibrionaceae bacterium]
MNNLKNKNILLGITGSIAAYKAVFLLRLLIKEGANVHVIMTKNAQQFVTPLTFQILSSNPVITDDIGNSKSTNVEHICLANNCDLVIIAPATANTIAKIAHGLADNILTSIILACNKTIYIAPSMNENMWLNPLTQQNINILKNYKFNILSPTSGFQACGTSGDGRMMEPLDILNQIQFDSNKDNSLINKKVIITAGPTIENIDPVRYISNYSSGKMGYALATSCALRGANVLLISGPTNIPVPNNIKLIRVHSAQEMLSAVEENLACTELFISCAAVADYKPEKISPIKLKKEDGKISTLKLVQNPDILKTVANKTSRPKIVVGFAAETNDIELNAQKKLKSKNADLIIANNVSNSDEGFNSDYNSVIIFNKNGTSNTIPKKNKKEIASNIIEYILENFNV